MGFFSCTDGFKSSSTCHLHSYEPPQEILPPAAANLHHQDNDDIAATGICLPDKSNEVAHNPLTRYRRLDCARWEGNEPLLAGFLAHSRRSSRRRRRNVWLARELAYLTQQERGTTD